MGTIIVIGGMISTGKSTVAELLSRELGSKVFYESVDDNPILPLFYTATDEEVAAKRYPFLLQLHFLNTRFASIKQALQDSNNVLDRSIYEDWYFADVNRQLGRISDLEFGIYEGLLKNMLQELDELPKKAPDLMVYLKASFETVLDRIGLRGREYEQDDGLIEYYRLLWSGYDDWVHKHYKASEVIVIDMDTYDVVANKEDAAELTAKVSLKLKEMGVI